MPMGRSALPDDNFINELQEKPLQEAIVQAGFAKRDIEFIDLFIENFKRQARMMRRR